MNSDGELVINIDSYQRMSEPTKLSAYFEGSELIIAQN